MILSNTILPGFIIDEDDDADADAGADAGAVVETAKGIETRNCVLSSP
jgi:hypothetical protein